MTSVFNELAQIGRDLLLSRQCDADDAEWAWAELVLGLTVKASRLYESVIVLVDARCSRESHILLRTLLETATLIKFLAPKDLVLTDATLVHDISGRTPLSRALRYNLYVAHLRNEREKWAAEYQELGFMAGDEGIELQSRIQRESAELKAAIPPEWAARIASRKNYHGMKGLPSIARVLGLADFVKMIYRPASWAVHAMDGLSFISHRDDRTVLRLDDIEPESAYAAAFPLHLLILDTVNDELFGSRPEIVSRLQSALARYVSEFAEKE